MITLTVDGKKVQVEKGQTILQACRQLGIYVPTFCWDERLDSIGACRICLVEVEKMPKLQVACTIPASEGMVVHTQSGTAKDGRQGIMELTLANHPLDCPTCDKGGECDLQDVAFLTRKDTSPMLEPKRRFPTDSNSTFDEKQIGPLIYLTMNRCIVCFKCVRFTSEVACEGDLGAFERGGHTQIAAGIGEAVKNEFSGNIVEICPVGALTAKPFRYQIRTWLTRKTPSVCNYCADGCNLTLWSANNKIFRATSRRNDAVDQGWICDKGRFGVDIVNHAKRIIAPLLSKSGHKVEISWDEAYKFASQKLKDIKEKNGAGAIAAIGSAHCSNEENYLLQKFFRSVIGTNHIDHRVFCKNPLPGPDRSQTGIEYRMTNSIQDLEKAELIVVLGCDLTVEHPIIGLRIKKAVNRLGAKLMVANNRGTKIGKFASPEIIYKYGSEISLINSLCQKLFELNLVAKDQINLPAEFENWLKNYDTNRSQKECGVNPSEVERVAKAISQAKSCIVLMGRDVITHPYQANVIGAMENLACLSGLFQKESSGLNLLWEYSNSQGALDMGVLPDRLPGSVTVTDSAYRNKLEQSWNSKIPAGTGYSTKQILEAIDHGEIKCLYVMQEDPIANFPDREFSKKALAKLELLIVQAILPGQLTEMATLVLPGASFAEKEGTCTNVEGRVQKTQAAFKPLGNSKPDWLILSELSLWMQAPFAHYSLQEISEEIAALVPGYSDRQYNKLPLTGERMNQNGRENKGEFQLRKVDFHSVTGSEKFPYVLLTGNVVNHSGTLSSWSDSLRQVAKEAFCEISLADAEKLQIENENWLAVESPQGSLKLKASISERLQSGTIFIPLNFPETPVNTLMDKDALVDFVRISKLIG